VNTVLLTGGTGFLGSHLLNELSDRYRFVLLKRSFSGIQRIETIIDTVQSYDIDTCPLETVFREEKIGCILHAATNYGRSGEPFHRLFQDNVQFPLTLLKLSIENNVELFINTDTFYTKSNHIYPSATYYCLSKIQLRQWLKALSDRIKVVNLRLEHVYGPNDNQNKFIPFLAEQLVKNRPEIPLTQGIQKRDFIYVDDVVRAYELVLNNKGRILEPFSEFEIGTGRATAVSELVKLMQTISNSQSKLAFGKLPDRDGEIMQSTAQTEAIAALGWKPKISLTEGIKRIFHE